jgi:hypothetical protein
LHNQVVPCTTSTLDDSDDNLVENDEFCVENTNNLDDEAEIKSFLSSLESHIHDSSSQKEIIDVYFAKLINILIYTQFQPQAHGLVK